jgi:hypothetical protein
MSVTAGDGGDIDQLLQSHNFTLKPNCEDDEDEDDLFHEQVTHSVGATKSPTVSWTYNPPPWYQHRSKPLFLHQLSPLTPLPMSDDLDSDSAELNGTLPGIQAALDSVSLYEACALVDPVLHAVARPQEKQGLPESVSEADVAQSKEAWGAFTSALLKPCTDCAESSSSKNPGLPIVEVAHPPVFQTDPDSCASCAVGDCCSSELSPDYDHECDVASRSFSSASSGFSLHRSASSSRSSAADDGVDDVDFDSPPIRDRPPLFSHPTDSVSTPPTTPPSSSPELSFTSSFARKALTLPADEPYIPSVTQRKYRYPQPQPPSRDEVIKGMADFHQRYAQKMRPLKPKPPKPDQISLSPGYDGELFGKPRNRRVASVTIKTASGVLLGEVGGESSGTDARFWEMAKAVNPFNSRSQVPGPKKSGVAPAPAPKDTPLSGGVLFTPLDTSSNGPLPSRSKHRHLKAELDPISLPNTPGPSANYDSDPFTTSIQATHSLTGPSKAHHTRQRSLTTLRSALLVRKSRSVEGSPRCSPKSLEDPLPGDPPDDGDSVAKERANDESCDKDSDSQAELEADSDGWIRIRSPSLLGKRRRRREHKQSVDLDESDTSVKAKEKECIAWPSLNDPPVFASIRDSTPSPKPSIVKHKKSPSSIPHYPTSHPPTSSSYNQSHSRSSSHSPPSKTPASPPFKVIPRTHPPLNATVSSISALPSVTNTPALPMKPAPPPVLGPGGVNMIYPGHPPASLGLPMYPGTPAVQNIGAMNPYTRHAMWMGPPGSRSANGIGVGVNGYQAMGHVGAMPGSGYGMGNIGLGYAHGHAQPQSHGGWWV